MKRLFLFTIFSLINLFLYKANSAIIQVAAPADLNVTASGIVGGANDGDIIELTTSGGAYTWTTKVTNLAKSITIRSASGLATKPVITMPTGILLSTTNNTSLLSYFFDGIDFNGNTAATCLFSAKSTSTGDVAITINNCSFHNFPSTAILLVYSASGTNWSASNYYSELKVLNSDFDGMSTLFNCTVLNGLPTKLSIKNCYFVNMSGTVLGTALYQSPGGLDMDHCTFYNCATSATYRELYIGYKTGITTPAIIKNTLFANRPATSSTVNVFGTAVSGSPNTNNAVYYTSGDIATIYPTALNYSITSDPVIVNKVATASAYLNAGTDSKVIGYVGYSLGLTTNLSSNVEEKYKVSVKNRSVCISLSSVSLVEIYSIDGILIDKTVTGGDYIYKLTKGVYVIRINGKSTKFIV